MKEGWTQKRISQALRIRYETIQDHLNDYKNSKKLKPENEDSQSRRTINAFFTKWPEISHFMIDRINDNLQI